MAVNPRNFVVIGNRDCRRIAFWQTALKDQGQPPAHFISYLDLLESKVRLEDQVSAHSIVRLESPGRNWPVEKALLLAGCGLVEDEFCHLSHQEIVELEFDKGRLLPSRQWYHGWRRLLERIRVQLEGLNPLRILIPPAHIGAMYDKVHCHQMMSTAGVPVPKSLGCPLSFEDLQAKMAATGTNRVFVKLAHGSSASGIVAYRTNGAQHHAVTTVELAGSGQLYNTRKLRELRDVKEIAAVIDALCSHRVHVEHWIPKAGFAGRTFDLRIVVIGGRARHTLLRLSQGPMTNLHLLNDRAAPNELRTSIGEERWTSATRAAEASLALFPGSQYAGVDLLLQAGNLKPAVLEINAFGDLLPGTLDEGIDTYGAELQAVLERHPC